jgi:hypothetical protein
MIPLYKIYLDNDPLVKAGPIHSLIVTNITSSSLLTFGLVYMLRYATLFIIINIVFEFSVYYRKLIQNYDKSITLAYSLILVIIVEYRY